MNLQIFHPRNDRVSYVFFSPLKLRTSLLSFDLSISFNSIMNILRKNYSGKRALTYRYITFQFVIIDISKSKNVIRCRVIITRKGNGRIITVKEAIRN